MGRRARISGPAEAHFPIVETRDHRPSPLVASVDMGYGHLRAAWPLAERLGVTVSRADRRPLASAGDRLVWGAAKACYEWLSRLSQKRHYGRSFHRLLDSITAIRTSEPSSDASPPDRASRFLELCIGRGFGAKLCRRLEATGAPLVSTFYALALAADRRGSSPVFCVVTDSDIHRVWAPVNGGRSRIHYLVPTPGTATRLLSYGVREDRISFTGFPLPVALEAGAEDALARRLGRLEGRSDAPPLITLAIGGAGAQAGRALELLRSLAVPLKAGTVRLALVAGLRRRLARTFRHWVASELGSARSTVEVIEAEDFEALYQRFNALLERTDVLWTKPSELSFYAALGLPMILDDPVGDHERANARWLLDAGAARMRPSSADAATLIPSWLNDGTLARCARNGYDSLPRGGTMAIVDLTLNNS
jgi:UDP-N-acetylglucosamine:LPS N-acetylglucosamine transferase